MVAAHPVEGAAHRVAEEPRVERRLLYPRVHLPHGIERLLRPAVGDQLECPEEPSAPDVAHVRVLAERAAQALLQQLAHRFDACQYPVLPQALLYRQSAGACGGVPEIGGAVLEESAAATDRVIDRFRNHEGADRLIARAEAFGDGDDVRDDALLLEGP